jgi:putative transposase
VDFVNQHRERFGVEPICDVLQVAPSTYYAAVSRPPSARQIEDKKLTVDLLRVYEENQQVYGAESSGRR